MTEGTTDFSRAIHFDLESGLSREIPSLRRNLQDMRGMYYDEQALEDLIKKEDSLKMRKIRKLKLLKKFLKKGMAYNDNLKRKFQNYLKENKMSVPPRVANFILKNGILRYKKRPVYDLEFDNQLVGAVKIINKMK